MACYGNVSPARRICFLRFSLSNDLPREKISAVLKKNPNFDPCSRRSHHGHAGKVMKAEECCRHPFG